jgi:hypothetical protein
MAAKERKKNREWTRLRRAYGAAGYEWAQINTKVRRTTDEHGCMQIRHAKTREAALKKSIRVYLR